jgi:hypothetical protein
LTGGGGRPGLVLHALLVSRALLMAIFYLAFAGIPVFPQLL